MTEVFVLVSSFDLEGESPVGVYATLEHAKRRGSWMAEELAWVHPDWWNLIEDTNGKRWELRFGSSSYIVRREVVQGV